MKFIKIGTVETWMKQFKTVIRSNSPKGKNWSYCREFFYKVK